MKKLLVVLGFVSAVALNAQKYDDQRTEPQHSEVKKNKVSPASQTKIKGKEDDYLKDFQKLNLSDKQKARIKALHNRRMEKNPKMKNSKQGLNEKQYQQEVEKVFTKKQLQEFRKPH